MKKYLAAIVAVLLVLSTTLTAFASTSYSDVDSDIKSASAYVFDGQYNTIGYDFDASQELNVYLKSGYCTLTDAQKTEYINDVKAKIAEGAVTDIGELALVAENLYLLDQDLEKLDIDGNATNLIDQLQGTTLTGYDNLDRVFYATELASNIDGLDDFGKAICEKVIAAMGETFLTATTESNADDYAKFILALSPYASDYEDTINSALALLKTYRTDTGYKYDADKGANTGSTAYALAAYSSILDEDNASDAYKLLQKFEDSTTGGYTDADDAYLATKDAVLGLEYYRDTLTPETDATTTTSKSSTKKSPSTGATTSVGVIAGMATMAGVAILLAKKNRD